MLIKSNRTALQTYKGEKRTFGTPCILRLDDEIDSAQTEFQWKARYMNRISSNNSQGRLFEGGDYLNYRSLEVVP